MPAAAGDLLHADRLAPPRDQARGAAVPVRAVLRVGAAARGGEDDAPERRGGEDPRARAELPRARRDPLLGLEPVGGEQQRDLVRRGRRGAQAHGGGRLRRLEGRHVGGERALVGGPRRHRHRPAERARPGPRARDRERRHAGQGRRLDGRHLAARRRHDALPDEPPELDGRRRVLDGHGRVRLRLVAGGLPRLAEDGRAGVDRAAAARLPERLPPARARARAGGAADDRAGPQLHPERLRAARERGLVVGHGLRLVGDPVRPDAVVRLAPGLRAAGVQRRARPAAGPLGLRVGAAQRRALVGRLQRRSRVSIIDRLAAAIRDSAAVSNPADPGIEACTNTCGGDYRGRVVHRALEVVPHVDAAGC